jgi:hypothetical protein
MRGRSRQVMDIERSPNQCCRDACTQATKTGRGSACPTVLTPCIRCALILSFPTGGGAEPDQEKPVQDLQIVVMREHYWDFTVCDLPAPPPRQAQRRR